MDGLIRFELAFHGQDRNQQDQGFRKLEGAAASAIALRFRELGDPQKFNKFIFELLDPFGIQLRNRGVRRFSGHASRLPQIEAFYRQKTPRPLNYFSGTAAPTTKRGEQRGYCLDGIIG